MLSYCVQYMNIPNQTIALTLTDLSREKLTPPGSTYYKERFTIGGVKTIKKISGLRRSTTNTNIYHDFKLLGTRTIKHSQS